jgi:hypothetical protein
MIDPAVLASVNVPDIWEPDWLWGLPLIVFTVLLHTFGLGTLRRGFFGIIGNDTLRRHPRSTFVMIVGCVTLSATVLHAIEAILWACAYRFLNALPDMRKAMLYSLNAITSYGHANLELEHHWELMGAMEALNGWLLFGLSTAFLFAVIHRLTDLDTR